MPATSLLELVDLCILQSFSCRENKLFPFLKFDNFGEINVTRGTCSEIYCKTADSMKPLNVAYEFEVKSPRHIPSIMQKHIL